jgi:hypothetical protein
MKSSRGEQDSARAAWLTALRTAGVADQQLVDCVNDIIDLLYQRPASLNEALRRFGAKLGAEGWPLPTVTDWLLVAHPHLGRRQRSLLCSFPAVTALASGWADSFVRGAGAERCLDPVTGVGTSLLLGLRIGEVHAQCRSLRVSPDDAFRLIVVDAPVDDLGPLERDAVVAAVARCCLSVFRSGETIARCGNRVVVLAGVSTNLEVMTAVLEERLASSPLVAACRPFVWDGRLPPSEHDVERFLSELVG